MASRAEQLFFEALDYLDRADVRTGEQRHPERDRHPGPHDEAVSIPVHARAGMNCQYLPSMAR